MAHRHIPAQTSLAQQFMSKSESKLLKSPDVDAITILASARPKTVESKLGLSDSARIVLDIVRTAQVRLPSRDAEACRSNINAQRTKSRTLECVDVAEQAYHLVNAIDAGVKGNALDINNVLQDYIKRLNQ